MLHRILPLLLLGVTVVAAVDAPTAPDHEFSFVVLGDSQFHLPNNFNQVIDEVVHLYPAFVLQVCDMISGKRDLQSPVGAFQGSDRTSREGRHPLHARARQP